MPATVAINTGFGVSGTPWDAIDNTQSLILVSFTVTLTGAYAALGDTLDLTPLVSSNAPLAVLPFFVLIKPFDAGGNSGFVYEFLPGTTLKNGKLQVLTSNGAAANPLLDLGAGAYPAAALADKLVGIAFFVRI